MHVTPEYFDANYTTDIVTKEIPLHSIIRRSVEVYPGCEVFCLKDAKFELVAE